MAIATLENVRATLNPKIDGTRVTYTVRLRETTTELWFDVPNTVPEDLAYDRADSVAVAVLPFLIRNGFEGFKSYLPISENLYYNLIKHVIPQLLTNDNSETRELEIFAPVTKEIFDGQGVATGMSLGIDSFATLSEYSRHFQLPSYRITHFTYFNVGSHHGFDKELGRSNLTSRELFEAQRQKVRNFSKTQQYPLIEVNSNLSQFLRQTFGRSSFNWTHTYRNAATALLLQKSIGIYYYSSAFNLDLFNVSLKNDSALYEKWLLPLLSNENIRFYSSNMHWNRLDKTKLVSRFPESYDYLTVCLLGADNCGRCMKCRKTLMALDVLGDETLKRFSNSFNLEEYINKSRREWFGSIHSRMALPGLPGQDMKDIFIEGRKNGYEHFPDET